MNPYSKNVEEVVIFLVDLRMIGPSFCDVTKIDEKT